MTHLSAPSSLEGAFRRALDRLAVCRKPQRPSFTAGPTPGESKLRYSTRRFSTADMPVFPPTPYNNYAAPVRSPTAPSNFTLKGKLQSGKGRRQGPAGQLKMAWGDLRPFYWSKNSLDGADGASGGWWTTSPCRPPASAPSPARVSPRATPRHPAPPRGAARAAISTDRSAGPRGGWLPLLVQDIAREAGISCVAGWAGRWTGAGPERQLRRHATCGQAASRGTVQTRASRHRMAPGPKADPTAGPLDSRPYGWARGRVRLDSRPGATR